MLCSSKKEKPIKKVEALLHWRAAHWREDTWSHPQHLLAQNQCHPI